MTPKPDNLPAPADMPLPTLIREMARILHNSGGEAMGAGYSAKLADEALRWAESLPGWRPIETAPKDGTLILGGNDLWNGDGIVLGFWFGHWREYPSPEDMTLYPTHWYDFGDGQPMPPDLRRRAGNDPATALRPGIRRAPGG